MACRSSDGARCGVGSCSVYTHWMTQMLILCSLLNSKSTQLDGCHTFSAHVSVNNIFFLSFFCEFDIFNAELMYTHQSDDVILFLFLLYVRKIFPVTRSSQKISLSRARSHTILEFHRHNFIWILVFIQSWANLLVACFVSHLTVLIIYLLIVSVAFIYIHVWHWLVFVINQDQRMVDTQCSRARFIASCAFSFFFVFIHIYIYIYIV